MASCIYCGKKGNEKDMIGVKPSGFNVMVYAHQKCAKKNASSRKKFRGD